MKLYLHRCKAARRDSRGFTTFFYSPTRYDHAEAVEGSGIDTLRFTQHDKLIAG